MADASDVSPPPSCGSDQWVDYAASECRACPAEELGCFMFDYFGGGSDGESEFDPQTDILTWHVNPGDIQIVSAQLTGYVLVDSGRGDDFSVDAEVDRNTMRFDFSGIAGSGEKLRVQNFHFTEACQEEPRDLPQDFRLDPNADEPRTYFGCNPASGP